MKPARIVACVWVRGNVDYGVEYVTRLRAMVARTFPEPFEFVTFTDRPGELPAALRASSVALEPLPAGVAGWWAKLRIFDPAWRPAGASVLYLDLDSLVVSSVAPLFEALESTPGVALRACPAGGTFRPRAGLRTVSRLNSSVMAFRSGDRVLAGLLGGFSWALTRELWGDQDFIGERLGDRALLTWPEGWVPRISALRGRPPVAGAAGPIVVLCKKPKNAEAAAALPWVADVWREE